MKGNIFSIELMIGTILIISLFTIFYSEQSNLENYSLNNLNLNTKGITYFYFGNNETTNFLKQNCDNFVFYNNDSNNFEEKIICEEIL